MKMKVWSSAALCACALAFAAACSKAPEDVALGFLEDIRDGNTSAATKVCTPNASAFVPMMIAMVQEDEDAKSAKFKVTNVDIDGDTAEVEITATSKDGSTQTNSIDLKKVDGDWKVDLKK